MYEHLLSSAGVRDADLLFAGEAQENASGRDALGTVTDEISGAPAERRSSAIGGTPPPRREPTIATVDALRETVPALNRALEDLGYPSPLELLLPDAADLARTCDVLFLLLRDRQEDLAARDAWADERARARADVAAAETRAERLRVSRDAEAAARAADANRRDRADEDSRARLELMTAERDAARRDLRASTQKLARLEHEARRRELEHDRLKARLSAVVESREMRGSRDVEKARGGVTLTSRLGEKREKGGQGAGPSPAVSLALHHSMMAAYEAKLRAFMHDANDLRAMLREAGVDPETRVTAPAPGPERLASAKPPGPTNGAVVEERAERRADGQTDVERADPTGERQAERSPSALDAFAFNLASLRDRLGDADAEARDANPPGGEDAAAAAAAAAEAAAPASPVEIALRWHEREHARLSEEALGGSSASGCSPGSPWRTRSETDAAERLAWNRVENDAAPVGSARGARAPSPPPSARPDALEAFPEVSSSEPDEDEPARSGNDAFGAGGAFAAARGGGSSSEELFEEGFYPSAREAKPEPDERPAPRPAPRREKVAASLRGDARAGDARAGASAPASPASPLDALLARHLGPSRAPAARPPRDRSEWLEKRRRRANPFATAAE